MCFFFYGSLNFHLFYCALVGFFLIYYRPTFKKNRLCPSRYLLNHLTKSNQIWCVSYSREWGVQQHIFLAPPPGQGPKGQILLNFIFKPFVCLLANKRYKTYQTGFSFSHLGNAPEVGLGAAGGQICLFVHHAISS